MPQLLHQLSQHFSSEEELFSVGLKLGVPYITVEHYIFNSKKSISLAGVRLLMYWYDGCKDKGMAHRTLKKALLDLVSSKTEVQDAITSALMQVSP